MIRWIWKSHECTAPALRPDLVRIQEQSVVDSVTPVLQHGEQFFVIVYRERA